MPPMPWGISAATCPGDSARGVSQDCSASATLPHRTLERKNPPLKLGCAPGRGHLSPRKRPRQNKQKRVSEFVKKDLTKGAGRDNICKLSDERLRNGPEEGGKHENLRKKEKKPLDKRKVTC